MVTIADKINVVLAQRGLLKRDLARALGISPQTATDICKGRSAVTLPHLRALVRFFGLRADFWLDEDRLEPGAADSVVPQLEAKLRRLFELGLLGTEDPAGLLLRLLRFARAHRDEFLRMCGELAQEEQALLGRAVKLDVKLDHGGSVDGTADAGVRPREPLPPPGRLGRGVNEADASSRN